MANDTITLYSLGGISMSFLKNMSCFVAIIQVASAAHAQGRLPATPGEIVEGVQSCLSATTDKAVEANKLKADGWHSASVTANGKPVDTSLVFFGKGNLLLITDKTANTPACTITAHIQGAEEFEAVTSAIMNTLNVDGQAKSAERDTIYFFPKGHIVQLVKTGKPDSPAIRIAVGFMRQ